MHTLHRIQKRMRSALVIMAVTSMVVGNVLSVSAGAFN